MKKKLANQPSNNNTKSPQYFMQHIHFSHFGSNYFLFNFFKANDFEREMAYRRRIIWGNAVDCTMCDIQKNFYD